MRVYENLIFQKKYFPHIYESYKNNIEAEQEVSVSMEAQKTLYIKDEILCICEGFEAILKEVFHVPIEIREQIEDELDQYNSVIIYDSCEEKVNHFSSQGILELYFTLPYLINNFRIRLEKRIDRKVIKKAVKVIVAKNLDFFEKMNLKDCEYETVLEDLSKLKSLFFNMKYFYKEKNLLSKLSKEDEDRYLDTVPVIMGKEDVIISMEICEQLSRDISERKFNSEYLSNILNICMKEFTEKAIEILKTIIIEADFSRNYEIVENYLNVSKDLELKLKDLIGTEIATDLNKITNYKSSVTYTDTYVKLLKSKIVLLDNIIEDSLEMIYTKVN